MSWLQIELRATPGSLPDLEDALLSCGAVSLSLVSDADEPVLEPAPGETPLWSSVRLQALFDLETDVAGIREALQSLGLLEQELTVAFVGPQDWQAAVRGHAVDEIFAGRLRVLPKDLQADADANVVQLRLDPGLAFGTGGHPTTRLCLRWLAEHVQPGHRVLDFGCGSGILAIAAALLGAQVVAVDHDPQAVMATRDNAAYNGVDAASLTVMSLEQWHQQAHEQCFDVVAANILAGPLQELAAEFELALAGGGRLVLSGVLEAQADAVMSAYVLSEFDVPEVDEGWVCLHGTKRTR